MLQSVCILTFVSTLFVQVGVIVPLTDRHLLATQNLPWHLVRLFLLQSPSRYRLKPDGFLDWKEIQTLVRSMPDLHKTLILAYVQETTEVGKYMVEEIAIATEHAPFRHRNVIIEVGAQRKKVNGEAQKRAKNENFMQDEGD
jgi:hypothetical protein